MFFCGKFSKIIIIKAEDEKMGKDEDNDKEETTRAPLNFPPSHLPKSSSELPSF